MANADELALLKSLNAILSDYALEPIVDRSTRPQDVASQFNTTIGMNKREIK
jgi:hypothetical protein